jgi:putative ABC transport system ATP-binding protein
MPAWFARDALEVDPEKRARELLDQLGLAHKMDVRPGNLSGGQKQRIAIARALFFKPRLLLCDEPTGSLDTSTGAQIIDTFRTLNAEGYTVVIITHEARVSDAAKRVIRIEDGRILESDEAA